MSTVKALVGPNVLRYCSITNCPASSFMSVAKEVGGTEFGGTWGRQKATGQSNRAEDHVSEDLGEGRSILFAF